MEDVRKNLNNSQLKKLKKMDMMLAWGLKHKKVYPYPDALFDRLRPYCMGGFPASIMFNITELCNGFCYDRAVLMSLAFHDCKVVHADIETLRITTGGTEYAEHAFVETPEFGGNKTWVVDTSIGLIFDKDFYYKLEKPKINKVFSKDEIMQFRDIKEIITSDFEKEKYTLPLTLPLIEACIANSRWLGTCGYKEKTLAELEHFKKAIGYDTIQQEVEEDVALMKKDPAKLDEKFQIVRDRYGREISRGGVPNPYYISPEELDAQEKLYLSIEDDEEKVKEYWNRVVEKSLERWEAENVELSELTKARLEEISKNPTANFYEKQNTQPGNN